jgi:hypothetical protein
MKITTTQLAKNHESDSASWRSRRKTTGPRLLVQWLNDPKGTFKESALPNDSINRVKKIIEAIAVAAAAHETFFNEQMRSEKMSNTTKIKSLRDASWLALHFLNDLLKPYLHYTMIWTKNADLVAFPVSFSEDIPIHEQHMVTEVMNLVSSRTIQYLMKCDCGKWFLAKRDDSYACCAQHRRKFYRSTPERQRRAAEKEEKQRQARRKTTGTSTELRSNREKAYLAHASKKPR